MMLLFIAVFTVVELALFTRVFWLWLLLDDCEAFVLELLDLVPSEGSHSFLLRV